MKKESFLTFGQVAQFMNGGLLGNLEWVDAHCKKRYRGMRAALKKALKNGSRQKLKFHYDPTSYALNFDDGGSHLTRDRAVKFTTHAGPQELKNMNKAWVYTQCSKNQPYSLEFDI